MSTRILMATVAALALAAPVAAQNQVKPLDTEQGAASQLEETQEKLQEANPAAGAEKSAPAMTEETPPAEEGAPAMTEEAPPAEEGAPAMTEGQPADEAAGQQMAEEPTPPADMKFIQVQEAEQFLANSEVIGQDVVNVKGEEVGSIADLVMDPDQKLVGIVLSVGGFLGVGDKWVAVPVDQIEFPAKDQPAKLLVEVSKEQLENAPDFVTRETVESQEAAEQAAEQAQQQAPAPVAVPQ